MSDTMREAVLRIKHAAGIYFVGSFKGPQDDIDLNEAICRELQAAQSQPVPMKLPKLPEPDTTHYAQWAGDRIKYHSVDQIIEFANARVTAALAAAQKGKS